jgi:class 3 adenylate cyclase/TolB-like protein
MSDPGIPLERRLAAFWFADIVGFTTLSARDEHAALAAVDALRDAARDEVGRAGGRLVKLSGDAVLAEFASADAALRAAIALRDALNGRVRLHFGVHLGEVATQHGDIYGDGVNIAARLQGHAAAGQILASEDIHRQVRASGAFRFQSVGALALKGVASPIAAYAVELAGMAVATGVDGAAISAVGWTPGAHARPYVAPNSRLVVVPFRLLRPDDDVAFLAFSLADAVSFSLSNLESLVVRSSHLAASVPADEAVDLRAIARQTDVDLVVTGTLLRVGERLQVTAELSDGRDGTRLSAFRTHAGIGDLFDLQEELAQRIVDALALPLTARERRLMRGDVPATARAYELYLRANEVGHRFGDWAAARDLYRAALAEDPDFAPAWAQLGRCHRLVAKYGSGETRGRDFADAEAALRRALELNPDLDLAHAYLAQLETELGQSGAAMLRLLNRLESRPRGVELLAGLVHALRYCGLLDESLKADRAARAIDPGARTSVAYTLFLRGDFVAAAGAGTESDAYVRALATFAVGRDEEAWAAVRSLSDTFPQFRQFIAPLRHMLEGDIEGALEAGTLAYRDFPDPEGRYFYARWLAWGGRNEQSLEVLEALKTGYAALPPPGLDPWLAGIDRTSSYGRLLADAEARRAGFRDQYLKAAWTRSHG